MKSAEQLVRELAEIARVDCPWGFGEHDEHAPVAVVDAYRLIVREELLKELCSWIVANEHRIPPIARRPLDEMISKFRRVCPPEES